ncbi:MAG: shikimate dehydrogenase [Rhizobiaceae bacterium]|nr:shikimate dehydrogenase [Rhizobiaceae bacterium]
MVKSIPRAFVIGWPISHSLSPDLHTYWLKQYGIDGSYEKIAVARENLPKFINNLKTEGFVGGNITFPHKESAFSNITDISATATRLKAINTLWFENGTLKADNTDGYGFCTNLDEFASDWRKAQTVLVLGAGGASKAIILALINAGIKKITIVNRTAKRATSLADQMGKPCRARPWSDIAELLQNTDLLINTTSLGMKGQPPLEIDISPLPASAIVTDIVYNPLQTDLLIQANSLKLKTVDGIGMLLHQAVPGFEKWFGVRPQVTSGLRQHVLSCLKESS